MRSPPGASSPTLKRGGGGGPSQRLPPPAAIPNALNPAARRGCLLFVVGGGGGVVFVVARAPHNMELSSNAMALITSDCSATRLPEHQTALIASGLCSSERAGTSSSLLIIPTAAVSEHVSGWWGVQGLPLWGRGPARPVALAGEGGRGRRRLQVTSLQLQHSLLITPTAAYNVLTAAILPMDNPCCSCKHNMCVRAPALTACRPSAAGAAAAAGGSRRPGGGG